MSLALNHVSATALADRPCFQCVGLPRCGITSSGLSSGTAMRGNKGISRLTDRFPDRRRLQHACVTHLLKLAAQGHVWCCAF